MEKLLNVGGRCVFKRFAMAGDPSLSLTLTGGPDGIPAWLYLTLRCNQVGIADLCGVSDGKLGWLHLTVRCNQR